ncbi:nucleotidyltransferase-like protein [Paenibacillus thermoaerophilus]|uniref:Nucleotidyltransferase-like protein n=1 Tax=Paenibacillus thermoaerophilus TaxID=1215385 RepID=A0ABW2V8Q4_9BACL|nr:nucleotidyltransferase-like protein [Paenibacillus thermoaerophilus]TMV16097.1 hypothetical protein FE781_08475 [Paenibacillus thermoaerophilus]
MRAIMEEYRQQLRNRPDVVGLLAVTNQESYSPVIDGFDLLLFVVSDSDGQIPSILHYSKDGYRIQERWSTLAEIRSWLEGAPHRDIVQWLLQGEILEDRDGCLRQLRERLGNFGDEMRERRLFYEFASFLKSYLQAKQYIQQGHYLDAYSNVLDALHHWARIAIVEMGSHPELTVWRQLRQINPGVYKLYEELTHSSESLEQRLRLVLLACEFSVMSKMERCCALLLRLLKSRETPWRADELRRHPELAGVDIDLNLVLGKLERKGLIREVAVARDEWLTALEIQYACR